MIVTDCAPTPINHLSSIFWSSVWTPARKSRPCLRPIRHLHSHKAAYHRHFKEVVTRQISRCILPPLFLTWLKHTQTKSAAVTPALNNATAFFEVVTRACGWWLLTWHALKSRWWNNKELDETVGAGRGITKKEAGRSRGVINARLTTSNEDW